MVWVLIASVSGCSLALTGPDPTRPSTTRPECDTGKGLVGLDGVVGGVFALSSLSALGNDAPEAAAVTGLIAVAFLASAARGNGAVNRCREAFSLYEGQGPEVADRPRTPEDPYDVAPRQRSVQRPVQPPPVASKNPTQNPQNPPPPQNSVQPRPVQPRPAQPGPAPAPAPDDWSDFWTEVP